MQVLEKLSTHAATDRVAVREVGPGAKTTLPYRELNDRVRKGAAALRAILNPGEVAILITGNKAEFYTAALAVWAADGALMPIHPSVSPSELATIIQRTGARLLLTSPTLDPSTLTPFLQAEGLIGSRRGWSESASDAPGEAATNPHPEGVLGVTITQLPAPTHILQPRTNSAALLLQSSGTTGLPKIALRSSTAIDAVARNVAEAAQLSPEDTVFAAIPICHSYGIENAVLAPIFAGVTIHLCDGLDLQTSLHELRHSATVFPGVPFMFECLASPHPTSDVAHPKSLRLAYSAGAPLPPQLSVQFEQAYSVPIGQLYGASELGSLTFSARDCSTVGTAMGGVRIHILDPDDPEPIQPLPTGTEGLVAIRAPSMLDRYIDGDAPIISGFFLTGDLGRLDSRGQLFITGRINHLIDIGGTKVNPAEVELTLKQHPAVADCVVVAIPVTQTVSRLKAIVIPSGREPLNPEDLRTFARTRLAGYKVPRIIEVRDSLPRTPTGKILRRELEAAR